MLATDDPGRIVAVLDWEMATLGDPLADLGLLLAYWGRQDGVPPFTTPGRDVAGVGSPGLALERRARGPLRPGGGRPVDAIDFYVVLALYKLAVIVEGIYARFRQGLTVEGVGATPWPGPSWTWRGRPRRRLGLGTSRVSRADG